MISPSLIIEFLKKNFEPNMKYVSGGREATVNSLFAPDYKMHMSVNTDTGLWQCFKSGRRGNFVQLVAAVNQTTFERARSFVLFESIKRGDSEDQPKLEPGQKIFYTQKEFMEEFECHPLHEFVRVDKAWKLIGDFVFDRKLDLTAFNEARPWFGSFTGKFAGRVFIPYYSDDDDIFFFQARGILPSSYPKYLNYTDLKASEVLYPFDWGQDRVVVTEGPVDAITLQQCGVNATSIMGSHISRQQARQLREFGGSVILSMDNDDVGKLAMMKNFEYLKKQGVSSRKISFLPCPRGKDWNEYYQKENAEAVKTSAFSSLSELYYRLYTS
jgi:5S rRNA maturation endonuclease (ribonuclease M5)